MFQAQNDRRLGFFTTGNTTEATTEEERVSALETCTIRL